MATTIPLSAVPQLAPIAAARSAGRPGWLPDDPAGEIDRLRERARLRRQARLLVKTKWAEVLGDAKLTQHYFGTRTRGIGDKTDIAVLMTGISYVGPVIDMHASVLAGRGLSITVGASAADEGTDPARLALNEVMDRGLFPARWPDICDTVIRDGETFLAVGATREGAVLRHMPCDGDGGREIICAMGPAGDDGQPPAIERRWIVERPDPADRRKTVTYLRVERHRTVDGVGGIVEQEAYRTASTDRLANLAQAGAGNDDKAPLRRVPLASVVTDGSVAELTVMGSRSRIVHIVRAMEDNRPRLLVTDSAVGGADEVVNSLTKITQSFVSHVDPLLRVPGSMIDKATGRVNTLGRFVNDPNKDLEYVQAQLQLEQYLAVLRLKIDAALVDLRMTPDLIGLDTRQTSQPTTYESRVLKSIMTLTIGQRTGLYVSSAMGLAMTLALEAEAAMPGRMFAAQRVTATVRPEIPADFGDRVRQQAEALAAGLTSLRAAVTEIHGEQAAPQILAEIQMDRDKAAKQQRDASFGALGMSVPSNEPEPEPVAADAGGDGGGA